VTVGEVYIQYGGVDGRLPLTYSWERRSKPADLDSNDHPGDIPFFVTNPCVFILKQFLFVTHDYDRL
jgi:hypothetical protein